MFYPRSLIVRLRNWKQNQEVDGEDALFGAIVGAAPAEIDRRT